MGETFSLKEVSDEELEKLLGPEGPSMRLGEAKELEEELERRRRDRFAKQPGEPPAPSENYD